MKMKTKSVYLSLEELRADKDKLSRSLRRQSKALKRDAVDVVLPSNNVFFNSDYSYMRFIGYAITAYKTYTAFRKVARFFTKRH